MISETFAASLALCHQKSPEPGIRLALVRLTEPSHFFAV